MSDVAIGYPAVARPNTPGAPGMVWTVCNDLDLILPCSTVEPVIYEVGPAPLQPPAAIPLIAG